MSMAGWNSCTTTRATVVGSIQSAAGSVLEYVARVWRRPVAITTVDHLQRTVEITMTPDAQRH